MRITTYLIDEDYNMINEDYNFIDEDHNMTDEDYNMIDSFEENISGIVTTCWPWQFTSLKDIF